MLLVAFFLSGAAGLIFEMVWLHRSGLVFGNSIDAATVVLSSFMAGLALGNALVGVVGLRVRALRAYALLEIVVAASGLALTQFLPHLTTLVSALFPSPETHAWSVNLVRFVIAFASLAIPTTAMGATLPLLTGAIARGTADVGRAVGRLYGWNTAGAVVGGLVAELFLIQWLGMFGTATVGAALNLAAGMLALAMSRADDPQERFAAEAATPVRPGAGRSLACAALAGFALMALEVVWFRFLSMYVLTTTLAMGLMLAVVLSAIAAGGLMGSAWLRRRRRADRFAPMLAVAAAVSVLVCYLAFGWLTGGTQVAEPSRMLWFAVVLTAVPSLVSGALFTLLSETIGRAVASPTRAAAWLTLANTAGAAAGPPLAAFALLPWLGMERSLVVIACVYGVLALLARLRPFWMIAVVPVVAWLALGTMEREYFPRVAQAYSSDGAQIVSTREGPTDTIFLMRQQWLGKTVYDRLVTNGFSMSGTAVPAMRYMRYFVYLPLLLHAEPIKRILIVCYGVGVTAGAATDVASAEAIDIVDVSRDIVAMSDEIYAADRHPLHDPRVRVHIDDGRSYMQRTTERYDLITGEPPPPRHPGVVNIYTREYFQLMHDRLAEGGMATYWVPVARPNPGTDVDTIVRAFCEVFDDCSLWNATPFDFMLLGSRRSTNPAPVIHDDAFAKPWVTPGLEARLREVGFELPQQIGATFLGDAGFLRELTRDAPPLTDEFPQRLRPVLSRPSLSDPRYGANPDVMAHYQRVLDVTRAREAFRRSTFISERWPAGLLQQTLPFFDVQAIINRTLWEGGTTMAHADDLRSVLTTTSLRTLPLWMLGSDEVKQRIGETSADESGSAAYSRALRAITGHDYETAERWIAEAERLGWPAASTKSLHELTLCLSGAGCGAR